MGRVASLEDKREKLQTRYEKEIKEYQEKYMTAYRQAIKDLRKIPDSPQKGGKEE